MGLTKGSYVVKKGSADTLYMITGEEDGKFELTKQDDSAAVEKGVSPDAIESASLGQSGRD